MLRIEPAGPAQLPLFLMPYPHFLELGYAVGGLQAGGVEGKERREAQGGQGSRSGAWGGVSDQTVSEPLSLFPSGRW